MALAMMMDIMMAMPERPRDLNGRTWVWTWWRLYWMISVFQQAQLVGAVTDGTLFLLVSFIGCTWQWKIYIRFLDEGIYGVYSDFLRGESQLSYDLVTMKFYAMLPFWRRRL
jgi:hypothetical protein